MKSKKAILVLLPSIVAVAVVYVMLDRPPEIPEKIRTSSPDSEIAVVVPERPADVDTPAKASVAEPARTPQENGWSAALGSNRVAAAEAMLKRQKVEREPTEAELAFVTEAHEIASAEDVKKARAFAAKHSAAEHPKVREAAVFALANCGTSCLAELTPFLADPDEGVRLEAQTAWQNEIYNLKDRQLKVDAVVAVMCVLNDEQALEPVVQHLVGLDRQTLEEIVQVVAEKGTDAGKRQAVRLCEAHGDE